MAKYKALGALARWVSPSSSKASLTASAHDKVTYFYQHHGRELVCTLTAVYGNPDDAAEVAQETYYRMFDHLVDGHRIEEPRLWAYRVSRNLMLDRLQARKNDVSKAEQLAKVSPCLETATAETILVARELSLHRQELLRRAFAGLSEIERQCVHGRGRGLKLREIAGLVGLSVQRVSEIVVGAIEKMQRTIDE